MRPGLRSTETYTETNFLRLYTGADDDSVDLVTLEHFSYGAGSEGGAGGWSCVTIVDGERMSRKDAVFIARSYAKQNGIPVIYECRED